MKMSFISFSKTLGTATVSSLLPSPFFPTQRCSFTRPSLFIKFLQCPQNSLSLSCSLSSRKSIFLLKASEAEVSAPEDEWLSRLPDKKKPLYSHSLPCIEAWLRSLGFYQSSEDRAVWFVEKPDWHAQLSLDVTDLCIRYLKTGPGNLEKMWTGDSAMP